MGLGRGRARVRPSRVRGVYRDGVDGGAEARVGLMLTPPALACGRTDAVLALLSANDRIKGTPLAWIS